MVVGNGYFTWRPLFFQPRDPETNRYFGNAIGNYSLEDQLSIVDAAGDAQKVNIQDVGEEKALEIDTLSQKFVSLWSIVDTVTTAITGEDPLPRADAHEFIEDFMSTYNARRLGMNRSLQNSLMMRSAPRSSNTEYYIWRPNYFQFKDPESEYYSGNVVGNIPLQEQIQTVRDAGEIQKASIIELGESEAEAIDTSSEKYRNIANINANVMDRIVSFFES